MRISSEKRAENCCFSPNAFSLPGCSGGSGAGTSPGRRLMELLASPSASSSPARPDAHDKISHAAANTSIAVETRMRKASATFTATFVGLSGFPNKVGEFTSSPTVELEGKLWSVRIYPGGVDEDSKGFLSCMIAYESRGHTRASFKISLVNLMNWKNKSTPSDGVKIFSNSAFTRADESSMWGDAKFISWQDLRQASNGHCVDDTIVMRVDMIIYGSVEHSVVSAGPTSRTRSLSALCTLQDDLRGLLFSPTSSDVRFEVDGEVIPAHKFIVCLRSEVFRAMLTGPMLEAQDGTIRIEDFEGVVVREMLRFLYTDQCHPGMMREHGDALLGIACKYAIPGLVTLAEHSLASSLEVGNVAKVLRIADMCNAGQLRARAMAFISQNARAAVQLPGFFDLLGFTLCQEVLLAITLGEATSSSFTSEA